MIQLSSYQLAIEDAVLNGTANLQVEAVAGSGKSTTIESNIRALLPRNPPRIRYCAFNKGIQTDFESRFAGNSDVQVVTFNALGHRVLARHLNVRRVISRKNFDIMKDLGILQGPEFRHTRSAVSQLVSLSKMNLLRPEDRPAMLELIDHMGIPFTDDAECDMILDAARIVLEHGINLALNDAIIDFDDQLYIPLTQSLLIPKASHVFVDEAQDLNVARIELCRRMLTDSGRIFIVGDTHQAIYGFSGAHTSAIAHMTQLFKATQLPLSICYRCPREVVRHAQQWVPHIEASPDAPEGLVKHWTDGATLRVRDLRASDHIVCRLNAPLFSVAMMLVRQRIPFNFLGKELGERLERLIDTVCKAAKGQDLPTEYFVKRLEEHVERERTKLEAEKRRGAIHALEDQADALRTLCERGDFSHVSGLRDVLGTIFKGNVGVKLSTIHKAKGLQAPRVFVLEPRLMPFFKAELPWELQQERNLCYVAATRAQEELHYIPLDRMEE